MEAGSGRGVCGQSRLLEVEQYRLVVSLSPGACSFQLEQEGGGSPEMGITESDSFRPG